MSKYKIRKVWITWHYQTRSRNLAKAFGLEIKEFFFNKNLLGRHLLSSLWTIKTLFVLRPQVVFIQYSYLLLILLFIYKKFFFRDVLLVVDCHTKALRRKKSGALKTVFWSLKRISFKAADLTLISNSGLIKDIEVLHGNFMILPDMIPKIDFSSPKEPVEDSYCVYISSFAVDEPFDEMLKLSNLLKNNLKMYWTGRIPNNVKDILYKYPQIIFTDYLSFNDYYNLIARAECLIALTTEEDCLQSGAYEAVSVEVPLVLSDTKSLRQFFGSAAIYTINESNSIYNAIIEAINSNELLTLEMKKLKTKMNIEFENNVKEIGKFINAKSR